MTWLVRVTKTAEKQLKRIPKNDTEKIWVVIDEMEDNPFYGDITKIEGESNVWRRRVGNYRVVYRLFVDEHIVNIYDIRRRTSNTY